MLPLKALISFSKNPKYKKTNFIRYKLRYNGKRYDETK